MTSRRAFTLVELLIVIGVIALVSVLMFPAYIHAKKTAKSTVDISNMRQIYLAVTMYEQDHDNFAPEKLPLAAPYTRSKECFASPLDVYRTPLADGNWPSAPLTGSIGPWESSYKVSYAYSRTVRGFDSQELYQARRDKPIFGMLASPWMADPISWMWADQIQVETGFPWSSIYGPTMEGPILRIKMDGSFFRCPKRQSGLPTASVPDLFGTTWG